jgi:uncharacterized protein
MLIRIKLLTIIFFTIMALHSFAVSFDCEKVAVPVEKMICGDSKLSSLDDELNSAYKSALNSVQNIQALKDAQRKWIKEDRNRCKDVQCLADIYTKRISELKSSAPYDNKNISSNNAPDGSGAISQNTNPDESEKKYPPYPDVWGIEMQVYGTSADFDFAAKIANGDCFFSYIKEQKGQLISSATFTHSWIKFFTQEYKNFIKDEYSKTFKQLRDEKRAIMFQGRYSITLHDGSTIQYKTLDSSARCADPHDGYLFKKDKNRKVIAQKMMLYLYNKPVKTSMNSQCERNWDYEKKYYFKKVATMQNEYLVPLEDDTFLFASTGPESVVIIRFDKDFNTKSALMGKNIFMIDGETVGKIFSDIDIDDSSKDNALYEYILKIKKEK